MFEIKEQIKGVSLIVALSIIEELKELNNWTDREVVEYLEKNDKWKLFNNDELMFALMHTDDEVIMELFKGEAN